MVLCETLRGVMTPHFVLLETAQAATSLFVWPQVYLWMTMVQFRTGSGAIPLAFDMISKGLSLWVKELFEPLYRKKVDL